MSAAPPDAPAPEVSGLSRSELAAAAARAGDEGRWRDAIAYLTEASFLDPSDGACFAGLGRAQLAAGDLADAMASLERAVRLTPDDPTALFHLGRAKLLAVEPEAAAARFRRCLALAPDDPYGARAALAEAERPLERLPAPFVRTLFDRYADRYDEEMTGALRYTGPRALRALWDRLPEKRDAMDVFDLGCGTGLCGDAFRDVARRLEGVDLSPRALAKADARGIYDRLTVGDAVETLSAAENAWDAILAADALPYSGDLASVFIAVANALRPGGRLLATCERAEEADGWRLGRTRRFAHGVGYLRRAAEAAGLLVEDMTETSVRLDQRQPVPGVIFALRRRAPESHGSTWR